jgi:hypothetical protein
MRTVSKPAAETAVVTKDPMQVDSKAAKEDKESKEGQQDDVEEDEEDEAASTEEQADKTKGGKNGKASKAKKAKGDRQKRGPARPYRKLPQSVLDNRITKLRKRIERTTAQAEEGKTFLEKYTREQGFRDKDSGKAEGA